MTPQQVFDKVVAHLRQQNSRAMMSAEQQLVFGGLFSNCAYLSTDGKRCAAGILIAEDYQPDMEGQSLSIIMERYPSVKQRLQDYEKLIVSLQRVHDSDPVEEWEDHFKDVARRFVLTYTPPCST